MSNNNYPVPPSHNTFHFGKVTIDSNFGSANCSFAERINANTYDIWIAPDHPRINYRVWFYFSIQGITKNTVVTFQIKNMQNQSRLLYEGLTPVVKEESAIIWKRISQRINLTNIAFAETQVEWSFSHQFSSSQKHYFALYYPWSLEDNATFLDAIMIQCQEKPEIYIHRANIISSLDGRPVQMLTISSMRGLTKKDQNFSDPNLFVNSSKPKVFDCDKKCIIIGARVHPGEVPGSHVMCGIIEELTQINELANILRDRFIFYLFPIVNPDGVSRGHFRTDVNGINLNRCYISPSPKDHSPIYAVKRVIMHCHNQDKYFAFFDLHAQASRKGNFIYGNSSNELTKQVEACLFPKILSLNSENFEYEGSNFMQKHMYLKDKADHKSKEGCGRVAIFNATKNPNSWTVQCSYNIGQTVNMLEPKKQKDQEPLKVDEQNLDEDLIRNYKHFQQQQSNAFYTVKTYRCLGKEICVSILDFIEANPQSRIANPANHFKSVQNIRLNLAAVLVKMSPTRFEHYFRKIYFMMQGSDNQTMTSRCLKALYFMIVKKARIPNLTQYLKYDDNTILYPIEKSPTRQTIKGRTLIMKNATKASLSPPLKTLSSQQMRSKQDNFFEIQQISMQLTSEPSKREITPTTATSKTHEKQKDPPTVKIIQINKLLYLRNTTKDELKMSRPGNLSNQYQSHTHITNYNNYKKRGKGHFDVQTLRKTYNDVIRLQSLLKFTTHNKTMLTVSTIFKYPRSHK